MCRHEEPFGINIWKILMKSCCGKVREPIRDALEYLLQKGWFHPKTKELHDPRNKIWFVFQANKKTFVKRSPRNLSGLVKNGSRKLDLTIRVSLVQQSLAGSRSEDETLFTRSTRVRQLFVSLNTLFHPFGIKILNLGLCWKFPVLVGIVFPFYVC